MLNAATHKDHFPLPFINQMCEYLAGHALLFLGWLLGVQSDFHSSRGPREDHVYMSIWDLCLSSDAFRFVQCPSNVSTLHV